MIHLPFVGSAAVPAIICRLDFRRYSLHGTISSLSHVRRASLDPAGLREQKTRTVKKTPANVRLFLGRLHRCHTPPATPRETLLQTKLNHHPKQGRKNASRCSDKEEVLYGRPLGIFLSGNRYCSVRPAGGAILHCILPHTFTYYTHIRTPAVNSRRQGWLQQAAHRTLAAHATQWQCTRVLLPLPPLLQRPEGMTTSTVAASVYDTP
ncbi:unnamed protein product [Ectocarpus sp. 8 AP-2014]